jgi:hypothetical protein
VLKLLFGDARGLKVELIEERILGLRHDSGRTNWPAGPERHAQADHGAKPIRPHQPRMPSDRCAPIVARDDGLFCPESVQHADHVTDEMKKRVVFDLVRTVRLAIAPHIGCHRMVSGGCQRLQLMAPGIP